MFYTLDAASSRDPAIPWPDVYFSPAYGRVVEETDGGRWECYYVPDKFLYVYMVHGEAKEIRPLYGYAGPYAYPSVVSQEEYDGLRAGCRLGMRARGYSGYSETVRVSPCLREFGLSDMVRAGAKTTYGLRASTTEAYWSGTSGNHRNMVRKAAKSGCSFEFRPCALADLRGASSFREMYGATMRRVRASEEYLYGDRHFELLSEVPGLYLATVRDSGGVCVGHALFLVHGARLHYHLSCSAGGANFVSDFLLHGAIEYAIRELSVSQIHLGGGRANGDSLARFKRRVCPCEFEHATYVRPDSAPGDRSV